MSDSDSDSEIWEEISTGGGEASGQVSERQAVEELENSSVSREGIEISIPASSLLPKPKPKRITKVEKLKRIHLHQALLVSLLSCSIYRNSICGLLLPAMT